MESYFNRFLSKPFLNGMAGIFTATFLTSTIAQLFLASHWYLS
jgi:hypothetical protein